MGTSRNPIKLTVWSLYVLEQHANHAASSKPGDSNEGPGSQLAELDTGQA